MLRIELTAVAVPSIASRYSCPAHLREKFEKKADELASKGKINWAASALGHNPLQEKKKCSAQAIQRGSGVASRGLIS